MLTIRFISAKKLRVPSLSAAMGYPAKNMLTMYTDHLSKRIRHWPLGIH
jgi:hypothetical protein